MAAPLPLPVRVGAVLVGLLLVAAVGAGALAIGYGSTALRAIEGGELNGAATSRTWFGLELENPSAVPATLRFVRPLGATNARIADARVLDRERAGEGVGVLSPPVGGRLGAAIARSRPIDGFVLPPHSRGRYQLVVLVERVAPGSAAVLRRMDIGYSALGLDHGVRSSTVLCIRAPHTSDCH
jgi:hypothetical protein